MVHSLTLSYTFGSMRCDSQASLLTRTFASPHLGYEPKAKVVKVTITLFYETMLRSIILKCSMCMRIFKGRAKSKNNNLGGKARN
jgi:hypothetical protein